MINIAIIDDNYREVENIIDIFKGDPTNYSYKYFNMEMEQISQWITSHINPVVMLDLFFKGNELGEIIFNKIKEIDEKIPIFIFTATGDLTTEQKYRDMGCYDYIVKSCVRKEDASILLQRIKKASETGSEFYKRFDEIRKMWHSDQGKAIIELKKLLLSNDQHNLMALYQLHEWLKKYIKEDVEEMSIAIVHLLKMLEWNCQEIESLQKEMNVDLLLDKALCYVHLGLENEAKLIIKEFYPFISDNSQGKRFINLVIVLHYLHSDERPNAKKIFSIIDVTPSSSIYEDILEWLYRYDKVLWNEAIVDYFNYWIAAEYIENRRILSLFGEELYLHITESDLLTAPPDTSIKFLYKIFSSEVEHANQEDSVDLDSLYNCCKFLFGKVTDYTLMSDKESICKTLNNLASMLFLNSEPIDRINFIDDQIINIGATDYKIIKDLLNNRPDRENSKKIDLLYHILKNLFKMGEIEKAAKFLREEESIIIEAKATGILEPAQKLLTDSYQFYRFGIMLEENGDQLAASNYFEKAILGFFKEMDLPEMAKRRNEVLLYIEETIKKLRSLGKNVVTYENRYRQLSSENIKLPLPLDNKKCAIVGGHNELQRQLGEIQKCLGGEFIYYGLDNCDRLVKSIKSGGIDIIIYIAGYAKHPIWDKVKPEIDKYNKLIQRKVELILLPTSITNISGIIGFLKRKFEEDQVIL